MTRARAWFVLGVLMAVYVVNFLDRQVLSILMEPIRRDLGLSDTQLGLLSGMAFALFYAAAGLPIARLADTRSRRNIIAGSLGLWSVMTAACGLAASFGQLLLGRVGVAVGEAGAGPAAHSMIADLFPEERRATALALFTTGVPIGILLGLVAGGWLNQAFDWRTAFVVVGAPGVVLAGVMMLTVREPARTHTDAPPIGWRAALASLLRIAPYKWLVLGSALHAFSAYGALQWNPAFLIRVHGFSTRDAGLALGLISGLTGIVGTLAGGWLADRLGRDRRAWYAGVPAVFIALGAPAYIAAYLVGGAGPALALLAIPAFLGNGFTGPVYAAVQSLAPSRTRAFAAAWLLFAISLIGFGLGPLAVGVTSDAIAHAGGPASLRGALALNVIGDLASVACFLAAARSLGSSKVAAQAADQTPPRGRS